VVLALAIAVPAIGPRRRRLTSRRRTAARDAIRDGRNAARFYSPAYQGIAPGQ
jgi:hypothetical protein